MRYDETSKHPAGQNVALARHRLWAVLGAVWFFPILCLISAGLVFALSSLAQPVAPLKKSDTPPPAHFMIAVQPGEGKQGFQLVPWRELPAFMQAHRAASLKLVPDSGMLDQEEGWQSYTVQAYTDQGEQVIEVVDAGGSRRTTSLYATDGKSIVPMAQGEANVWSLAMALLIGFGISLALFLSSRHLGKT